MDVRELPGIKKYSPKSNIVEKIKPAPALIIFMIFALALRLFFVRYRFAVAFDEVNYLKLGVSGHLHSLSEVLHTYWSPLLPTLIAFFCNLFPDYEFAARMVSILAGVFLLIPVYFLGKNAYNEKVGILAAAFVAVFPPIAFQSTLILTEPLMMLFGTLAVFSGLKMLRQYSAGHAVQAGLFAGLAYLAHPLGVGFLALLIAWLLAGCVFKWFLIKPLRVAYLLPILAVGFVTVASPYLIYLKKTTGAWTISAKGSANLQMETPLEGEESSFRALDASNTFVPIDLVFHQGSFLQATNGGNNPVREVRLGHFIVKYIKNFADMLKKAIPEVLTFIPLLLLGVGFIGNAWAPQQGKNVLYLVSFIVFFWLILIPSFHINLRYLTPLWPICAIWIAKGLLDIHAWLSHYLPLTRFSARRKLQPDKLAAVFVIMGFFALSFLPEFGRVIYLNPHSPDYTSDAVEQKKAGEWLKKNISDTPVIMSRNHAVDFYAGNYDITESVTVPTNSFERVLEYAKHRDVDYIVLNERYLQDYPQLGFFLTDNEVEVKDLRLVYKDIDSSGLLTVIYKLL